MAQLQVCDRVAYSRQFLHSTGQFTGWAPFARGEVIRIVNWQDTRLCVVKWDSPDDAGQDEFVVREANLVREDRLHLEPG